MVDCDKCGQAPGTHYALDAVWLCDDCFLFIKYMLELKRLNPHMSLRW